MRLFGWSGKFYFPEIEIRWPKKNAFDHGSHFTLLFSLQSISGKFYRERERARARELAQSDSRRRTPSSSPRQSRSRRQTFQSPLITISWSVDREIAYVGERGRSEIAIDASRDRVVDRDLAKKARSRSQIAIDGAVVGLDLSSLMIFFWVVACVFLDLCFPSSFPNTRKFFPENFLKCNQTHGNIFLFRKLAFPKNTYFPENVLQQPNTS